MTQILPESTLWASRYIVYRDLGPSRTLSAAYAALTPKRRADAPLSWLDASEKWGWRERVETWDRERADEKRTQGLAIQERERQDRVTVLKAVRGRLTAALMKDEGSTHALTDDIAKVTRQLRAEFAHVD